MGLKPRKPITRKQERHPDPTVRVRAEKRTGYHVRHYVIDRAEIDEGREERILDALAEAEALGLIAYGSSMTEGWPAIVAKEAIARTDPSQVPPEVHERGWQWRPTTLDSAFAPPFGTIRACGGCGALVAGGPTVCGKCVPAGPVLVTSANIDDVAAALRANGSILRGRNYDPALEHAFLAGFRAREAWQSGNAGDDAFKRWWGTDETSPPAVDLADLVASGDVVDVRSDDFDDAGEDA